MSDNITAAAVSAADAPGGGVLPPTGSAPPEPSSAHPPDRRLERDLWRRRGGPGAARRPGISRLQRRIHRQHSGATRPQIARSRRAAPHPARRSAGIGVTRTGPFHLRNPTANPHGVIRS